MSQRAKVLSSEGKADCGLGSSWWKHSLHVFVIRGNKKKKKKEWKEEEEVEEGEKKGGRGGQMCLQVRAAASRWRCETVRRVKTASDRQTGKQTDSWVLSRQEEHLEKLNFSFLFQS